jgi:hypothetical protein
MPGGAAVQAGLDALAAQGLGSFGANFSPWYYNIQTGKFEREASNAVPSYECCRAFGQFEYLTSLKKFIYLSLRGVALFDPAAKQWSTVTASGTGPSSSEWGGCYDAKRDKVYAGQNPDDFYSYDVQTQTWTKLNSQGPGSLTFDTNDGGLEYDSYNDMVIITDIRGARVCPYNPATDTWEPTTAMPSGFSNTNGHFYDPVLGVHFVFTAGDSRDDGRMWVYRYKGNPLVTELSDTDHGPAVSVSPNPFKSRVIISIDEKMQVASCKLSMFDINGNQLEACNLKLETTNTVSWNASGLPSGVYIIRVTAGNRQYTQRMVLQH